MSIDKNRRKLLALVLPTLEGCYPADLLRGFEKAAGEAGYCVLTAVAADAPAEVDKINLAVACGAAGVTLLPCAGTKLTVQQMAQWVGEAVCFSVVDRNPGLDHVDFVGCDNRGGGLLAAEHMHKMGFDHALFVSDSPQAASAVDRFEGFCKGVGQFGMQLLNEGAGEEPSPDWITGTEDFAKKLEFFKAYLPFAVLASTDRTAMLVMAALRDAELKIGSDVGVIGFGNSSICQCALPPLTSVAQNGALIGEAAAKLALQKIASGDRQVVRHVLPAQLVARQSCGEH